MKKLLVILNVLLLIAVAVLYYLHFSGGAKTNDVAVDTTNDSAKAEKPVVKMPTEIKSSKIVYINVDVLNENYQMVKDLTASLKAQESALNAQYEKKAADFEQKYMDFQQKAQQGLLSENQSIAAQKELMKQKEELDGMELKLQKLIDKMQVDNEKVFKTVIDYIKEYNSSGNYNYILSYTNNAMSPVLVANDSLDITNEIVDGLNEQYKNSKKK